MYHKVLPGKALYKITFADNPSVTFMSYSNSSRQNNVLESAFIMNSGSRSNVCTFMQYKTVEMSRRAITALSDPAFNRFHLECTLAAHHGINPAVFGFKQDNWDDVLDLFDWERYKRFGDEKKVYHETLKLDRLRDGS